MIFDDDFAAPLPGESIVVVGAGFESVPEFFEDRLERDLAGGAEVPDYEDGTGVNYTLVISRTTDEDDGILRGRRTVGRGRKLLRFSQIERLSRRGAEEWRMLHGA